VLRRDTKQMKECVALRHKTNVAWNILLCSLLGNQISWM